MFLTAPEAAEELGVSVSTLYAYVSRKQIRSQALPGSKSWLYWRDDIERLKNTSPAASRDALAPSTSITLITAEGPFYRGWSAIELAHTQNAEQVCALLWGSASVGAFGPTTFRPSPLYDKVLAGLGGASTMEKVLALLPILERSDPRAFDLAPEGFCRTGMEMMRWFAAIISDEGSPTAEPLHEMLAARLKAPEGFADIIRRVLVLGADHELDPSTYAVRAVANTGVSPYAIALAGLATARGRRLTFGRAHALSQMFREIVDGPEPEQAILGRVREGEALHGFNSRIYPAGDPRAEALLSALRLAYPDDVQLGRLDRAIEAAREATGHRPDFVIPLTFVGHRLGLVGQEGILLRLARMAGWIAHALEQYHGQELVRPRSVYVGELPRKATLPEQRPT